MTAPPRRPRHNTRGERMIDHFAEVLSECGTIAGAAKALGVTRDYGRTMFKRIRAGLGEQAR